MDSFLNQNKFHVTNDVLASKSKRLLNYIIDLVVFYSLFIIFGIALGLLASLFDSEQLWGFIYGLDDLNPIVDRLVSTFLMILLYFILESTTQRSIAKYITGTKVVMINGEKPSPETIVKRSLSRIIPFNAFSFLGNSSRGWHDTISKTYVIDIKKFDEKFKLKSELELLGKSE